MNAGKKRTRRYTNQCQQAATLPVGLQKFWIEVGWRSSDASSSEEQEWVPSQERSIVSDVVQWWPAFVEIVSFDLDQYKLLYSHTASSTSLKDLDYNNKHFITFLFSGWLRHTKGCEEGNVCVWRNPLWESVQSNELKTKELCNSVEQKSFEEQLVELKGCFLELQHVVQNERRMQSDVIDRVILMETKMLHVQVSSHTDELRSFVCNAIVTGL